MFFYRKLRSSAARQARIDRIFRNIAYVLMVVYVLWVLTVWVSQRAIFHIDTIVVTGTYAVSANDLREIADRILGKKVLGVERRNSLFAPTGTISDFIYRESDRILSVDTGVYGHTLRVGIVERMPAYLWCPPTISDSVRNESGALSPTSKEEAREGCYFASVDGYIFAPAPVYAGYPFFEFRTMATSGPADRLPTLAEPVGLYVLPVDALRSAMTLRAHLAEKEIIVRSISLTADGDMAFMLDSGRTLLWSPTLSPGEAARRLILALPEINRADATAQSEGTPLISIIDLRFGNKIFYK